MAILERVVPAAAAGATQDTVIGECEHGGTVTGVSIIPAAAVTAHGTNYRTLTVTNKGQAGVGSTAVSTFALDTPGTDNLVAFDEKDLPLSGTLTVADGDVLSVAETVAAAGLAHGGYTIKVVWSA
jgi:hypothetical protein